MRKHFIITELDIAKAYEKVYGGDKDLMLDAIDAIGKFVMDEVVERQGVFVFPNGLGRYWIAAKRNNLAADNPKYYFQLNDAKKGKKDRKRYLNLSTFGYYFYPMFKKNSMRLNNESRYGFRATGDTWSRYNGIYKAAKSQMTAYIRKHNIDPGTFKIKRK